MTELFILADESKLDDLTRKLMRMDWTTFTVSLRQNMGNGGSFDKVNQITMESLKLLQKRRDIKL
jgi:hypothetical protein